MQAAIVPIDVEAKRVPALSARASLFIRCELSCLVECARIGCVDSCLVPTMPRAHDVGIDRR